MGVWQARRRRPEPSLGHGITYIRTHEGWLYLAVVLDLFSRQVIGWSMQPRMDRDLALNALLMAIWKRKPTGEVNTAAMTGRPSYVRTI